MRALTLTQPWASLVAFGYKHIETRSWRTPYRGPLVAADLLSRGLEVFQAVNPSGPVDLIAMDESEFYRIEVKSIKERSPKRITRDIRRNASRFDVLAMVDENGVISYAAHSAITFGTMSIIKTDPLLSGPSSGRVCDGQEKINQAQESATA